MRGENLYSRIRDDIVLCNVAIILVSPEILSYVYCYGKELKTALDRSAAGELAVMPIIIRDCKWTHSPLDDFEVFPSDNVSLIDKRDNSRTLRSIAREVFERAATTKVLSESRVV